MSVGMMSEDEYRELVKFWNANNTVGSKRCGCNTCWDYYFGPGGVGPSTWVYDAIRLRAPMPGPGQMFGLDRQAGSVVDAVINSAAKSIAAQKTGFNCTVCNEKNDFAAANQPNGTYVCYKCR